MYSPNSSCEPEPVLVLTWKKHPQPKSRKDFAAKEARETHYWLRLIRDSQLCMNIDVDPLIEDREELIRMLTAIVKTAQKSC